MENELKNTTVKQPEKGAACGQSAAPCYVQISLHEKGFWQADYFLTSVAEVPDWFCTGKKGDSPGEVVSMASAMFPGIRFTFPEEEMECSECGTAEDVDEVNGDYLCGECAELCLRG